ncbi:MAG: hypothetical protein Q7T03_02530 [Deltaproteobacteria bacterium]|nr:hypothetical protein [Deltaproteobacteria bacterium]
MTVVGAKLATQVVKKAMENSQSEAAKPLQNGQGSSFQEMLQNTGEEMGFADMLGIETEMKPGGQSQAISAQAIPFDADGAAQNHSAPSGGDKVVSMLADFNQQQTHMDGLVNEILYSNKKYSNQELLAIQAHVFHVAQMTELTVKSVELAVSSFKGVMNTQIQ